jgi:hypothetical protein
MHPSSEHASWPAKTPHWSTPIRILAAAALLATAFTQVDAAEWQVKPLTGEQARDYDLDTAFYKRATFVQGILIATSARVPDHVHREAAYQFDSIMRLLNVPVTRWCSSPRKT